MILDVLVNESPTQNGGKSAKMLFFSPETAFLTKYG